MNFAFKMMNSALYVMHSALKMSHSVEGGYPYRAPGYCTIDHLCVPTFNSGSFSGNIVVRTMMSFAFKMMNSAFKNSVLQTMNSQTASPGRILT